MTLKETVLMREVWVPSESPFRFTESVDPKTGTKKYILTGLMLPFDKISRNNVMYNKESVIQKHKQLIGKPVMYNHKVDTDMLPKGHFIDSWCEDDGWYYKADIDPAERDLIRKLERGDLRHVSIQLIGGKVVERLNESNQTYTEAWVDDVIEGSIVPAPGFLDTTAKFTEALHPRQSLVMEFKIGDKVKVVSSGEEGEIVDIVEGEDAFLVQLSEGMRKKIKREDVRLKEAFKLWQYFDNIEDAKAELKIWELSGVEGEIRPYKDGYGVYLKEEKPKKEDITTSTGKGAMAPSIMVGEDKERKKEASFSKGKVYSFEDKDGNIKKGRWDGNIDWKGATAILHLRDLDDDSIVYKVPDNLINEKEQFGQDRGKFRQCEEDILILLKQGKSDDEVIKFIKDKYGFTNEEIKNKIDFFKSKFNKEKTEHPNLSDDDVWNIVIDHQKIGEYENEQAHPTEIPDMTPKKDDVIEIPTEEEIKECLNDIEVINILREFKLNVGDAVRIPFGIKGIDTNYMGVFGWISKIDDDSYTVEFKDGKKIKVPREVFDLDVLKT